MAFWRSNPRDPSDPRRDTRPSRTEPPAPRLTIKGRPFALWGADWPNVDVVGESHYAAGIRSLFPQGVDSSVPLECQATLIPDPANKHDPNAVAVVVSSKVVGYLTRDDAARHSPALGRLVDQGFIPVTAARVYASVYGGFDGPPAFLGSVRIALAEPHLIAPVNSSSGVHRMLPHGNALQLKDEQKHLDVLAPLVADNGEAWVHATLHRLEIPSGKSIKEMVEVHVDGQPIGTLTPAMSAHYLPTIGACNADDILTAARVLLKGNPIKVEAVLHAAKAHELEAGWLESPPEGAPPASGPTPRNSQQVQAPLPDQGERGARTVPPKPTRIVFNSPPNWPQPPLGYEPPPGWKAPADWPDAPAGWKFWLVQ